MAVMTVARRYKLRECEHCGREFQPKAPTARYCSEECRADARRVAAGRQRLIQRVGAQPDDEPTVLERLAAALGPNALWIDPDGRWCGPEDQKPPGFELRGA